MSYYNKVTIDGKLPLEAVPSANEAEGWVIIDVEYPDGQPVLVRQGRSNEFLRVKVYGEVRYHPADAEGNLLDRSLKLERHDKPLIEVCR